LLECETSTHTFHNRWIYKAGLPPTCIILEFSLQSIHSYHYIIIIIKTILWYNRTLQMYWTICTKKTSVVVRNSKETYWLGRNTSRNISGLFCSLRKNVNLVYYIWWAHYDELLRRLLTSPLSSLMSVNSFALSHFSCSRSLRRTGALAYTAETANAHGKRWLRPRRTYQLPICRRPRPPKRNRHLYYYVSPTR